MVQRREGLGFAGEPGEPFGVARERVRQDFERDVTIQLRVAGPVDLAHATFANLCRDFVDAEARAGGEGQSLRGLYGPGGRARGGFLGTQP